MDSCVTAGIEVILWTDEENAWKFSSKDQPVVDHLQLQHKIKNTLQRRTLQMEPLQKKLHCKPDHYNFPEFCKLYQHIIMLVLITKFVMAK